MKKQFRVQNLLKKKPKPPLTLFQRRWVTGEISAQIKRENRGLHDLIEELEGSKIRFNILQKQLDKCERALVFIQRQEYIAQLRKPRQDPMWVVAQVLGVIGIFCIALMLALLLPAPILSN